MDTGNTKAPLSMKLTVYFEDPFWVGILERIENGQLTACKITFGAEPKDYEVQSFLMENYYRLRFSPAITADRKEPTRMNPKRKQRLAKREMTSQGIGTKSQQAMKLLQEEHKKERKTVSRERRLLEEQRLWEMKQQKKKEKKRGR